MSFDFKIRVRKVKTTRNLRWFSKMCLQLSIEVEYHKLETPVANDAGNEYEYNMDFSFKVESLQSLVTIKLNDLDQGQLFLIGVMKLPVKQFACSEARTIALAYNGQVVGYVTVDCMYETVINEETQFIIKNLKVLEQPDQQTKFVLLNMEKALDVGCEQKALIYDIGSTVLTPEELAQEHRVIEIKRSKEKRSQGEGAWQHPAWT